MKNFATFLVAAILILSGFGFIHNADARGGFSGGRSFVSRSSVSRPVFVSRPVVRQTIVNHTTVVHQGGSGHGFVTGMLVGHMMSQPTTVVAPQPIYAPVAGQQMAPAYQEPVVVQHDPLGSFVNFLGVLILLGIIGLIGYNLYKRSRG